MASFAAIAFRSSAASENAVPFFTSGRYQLVILQPQREVPSIRLFGLDGRTTELSALRGKPVLLNFWATWCLACRTELPMLDRLQKQNAELHVLAVSEDRTDRVSVVRFVEKLGIRNLPIFRDPNGYVGFFNSENKKIAPFALYGMPITYAITAKGWVVGYISGAVDWTSSSAVDLIEFLQHS